MGSEASGGIDVGAVRDVLVGRPVWETPVIEVAPMAAAQSTESGTTDDGVSS